MSELVGFNMKPIEVIHSLIAEENPHIMYEKAAKASLKYNYNNTTDDILCTELQRLMPDSRVTAIKKDLAQTKKSIVNKKNSGEKVKNGADPLTADLTKKLDIEFVNVNSKVNSTGLSLIRSPENLKIILDSYGIKYDYDPILRKQSTYFPENYFKGEDEHSDNKAEAHRMKIVSLCELNSGSSSMIRMMTPLMVGSEVNKVLNWVLSVKWDGKDRIGQMIKENIKIKPIEFVLNKNDKIKLEKINDEDEYDLIYSQIMIEKTEAYKQKVVRMWLTQTAASLDGAVNTPITNKVKRYDSVLVFVGCHGEQKSTFVKSLLPSEKKWDEYIKTETNIMPFEKEIIRQGLNAWIVELGEVNKSFKKKEIDILKVFVRREFDEAKLLYSGRYDKFRRRTTFCCSVDNFHFLEEDNRNKLFLPLNISSLTPLYKTNVNVQQLHAQIYQGYLEGDQWWPDEELHEMLENVANSYIKGVPIKELVANKYDLLKNDGWCKRHGIIESVLNYQDKRYTDKHPTDKILFDMRVLSCTEILEDVGVETTQANQQVLSALLNANEFTYKPRRTAVNGSLKKGFKLSLRKKMLDVATDAGHVYDSKKVKFFPDVDE